MNLNWINKQNNDNLIIFFNGWGMDSNVIRHLSPDDFDVLGIYDYNNLSPLPDTTQYKNIHVIAWSMGVMIATIYDIKCTSATAINGTPYPIHTEYGINPKVYKLMELGFNEQTKDKFTEKMFDKLPINYTAPDRTTENRKSELTALKKYTTNTNYKFTRIIVSDNDKIIPTKSRLNFWKNPEIISGGHCIFYNYKNWKELL